MRHRIVNAVEYPFYVNLPKGCVSPTDSIYKRYDIVSQGMVLNHWGTGIHIDLVRSSKPFTLQVKLVSGKIKELIAKDAREAK